MAPEPVSGPAAPEAQEEDDWARLVREVGEGGDDGDGESVEEGADGPHWQRRQPGGASTKLQSALALVTAGQALAGPHWHVRPTSAHARQMMGTAGGEGVGAGLADPEDELGMSWEGEEAAVGASGEGLGSGFQAGARGGPSRSQGVSMSGVLISESGAASGSGFGPGRRQQMISGSGAGPDASTAATAAEVEFQWMRAQAASAGLGRSKTAGAELGQPNEAEVGFEWSKGGRPETAARQGAAGAGAAPGGDDAEPSELDMGAWRRRPPPSASGPSASVMRGAAAGGSGDLGDVDWGFTKVVRPSQAKELPSDSFVVVSDVAERWAAGGGLGSVLWQVARTRTGDDGAELGSAAQTSDHPSARFNSGEEQSGPLWNSGAGRRGPNRDADEAGEATERTGRGRPEEDREAGLLMHAGYGGVGGLRDAAGVGAKRGKPRSSSVDSPHAEGLLMSSGADGHGRAAPSSPPPPADESGGWRRYNVTFDVDGSNSNAMRSGGGRPGRVAEGDDDEAAPSQALSPKVKGAAESGGGGWGDNTMVSGGRRARGSDSGEGEEAAEQVVDEAPTPARPRRGRAGQPGTIPSNTMASGGAGRPRRSSLQPAGPSLRAMVVAEKAQEARLKAAAQAQAHPGSPRLAPPPVLFPNQPHRESLYAITDAAVAAPAAASRHRAGSAPTDGEAQGTLNPSSTGAERSAAAVTKKPGSVPGGGGGYQGNPHATGGRGRSPAPGAPDLLVSDVPTSALGNSSPFNSGRWAGADVIDEGEAFAPGVRGSALAQLHRSMTARQQSLEASGPGPGPGPHGGSTSSPTLRRMRTAASSLGGGGGTAGGSHTLGVNRSYLPASRSGSDRSEVDSLPPSPTRARQQSQAGRTATPAGGAKGRGVAWAVQSADGLARSATAGAGAGLNSYSNSNSNAAGATHQSASALPLPQMPAGGGASSGAVDSWATPPQTGSGAAAQTRASGRPVRVQTVPPAAATAAPRSAAPPTAQSTSGAWLGSTLMSWFGRSKSTGVASNVSPPASPLGTSPHTSGQAVQGWTEGSGRGGRRGGAGQPIAEGTTAHDDVLRGNHDAFRDDHEACMAADDDAFGRRPSPRHVNNNSGDDGDDYLLDLYPQRGRPVQERPAAPPRPPLPPAPAPPPAPPAAADQQDALPRSASTNLQGTALGTAAGTAANTVAGDDDGAARPARAMPPTQAWGGGETDMDTDEPSTAAVAQPVPRSGASAADAAADGGANGDDSDDGGDGGDPSGAVVAGGSPRGGTSSSTASPSNAAAPLAVQAAAGRQPAVVKGPGAAGGARAGVRAGGTREEVEDEVSRPVTAMPSGGRRGRRKAAGQAPRLGAAPAEGREQEEREAGLEGGAAAKPGLQAWGEEGAEKLREGAGKPQGAARARAGPAFAAGGDDVPAEGSVAAALRGLLAPPSAASGNPASVPSASTPAAAAAAASPLAAAVLPESRRESGVVDGGERRPSTTNPSAARLSGLSQRSSATQLQGDGKGALPAQRGGAQQGQAGVAEPDRQSSVTAAELLARLPSPLAGAQKGPGPGQGSVEGVGSVGGGAGSSGTAAAAAPGARQGLGERLRALGLQAASEGSEKRYSVTEGKSDPRVTGVAGQEAVPSWPVLMPDGSISSSGGAGGSRQRNVGSIDSSASGQTASSRGEGEGEVARASQVEVDAGAGGPSGAPGTNLPVASGRAVAEAQATGFPEASGRAVTGAPAAGGAARAPPPGSSAAAPSPYAPAPAAAAGTAGEVGGGVRRTSSGAGLGQAGQPSARPSAAGSVTSATGQLQQGQNQGQAQGQGQGQGQSVWAASRLPLALPAWMLPSAAMTARFEYLFEDVIGVSIGTHPKKHCGST